MQAAGTTPWPRDATDEELMRRLSAGSQDAIEPLYSRYAPLIFGMAARSLDPSAAEEIVQEVFLAAWRAAGSFDPRRGALQPWLLQIAHFRILNELRSRRRSVPADRDADGLRLVNLPDPDPDPADSAWREEERAAVRSALAALPPAQQEALQLHFFAGMTHEQVAERLHVPLGTAKTRIRAGLHKLRARLAPMVAVLTLATAGGAALLGLRYHQAQRARDLDEQALRLVTASDITSVRLTPALGATLPAEAHGTYRGRAGSRIATMNLSHVPPLPPGQTYQAWARYGDTWLSLGTVRTAGDGSALLIADTPALAALPDAVQVTVERGDGSTAPRGPVVIVWDRG